MSQLFVSVFILAALASAIVSENAPPVADEYIVPKVAFSNTSRAIFVAGLEGTGHHLFRNIIEKCAGLKNNGPLKKQRKVEQEADFFSSDSGSHTCVADKASMCLLYNNTPKSAHPHDSLFNSHGSPGKYIHQRQMYRLSMRKLVRGESLAFLNVDLRREAPKDCVTGMMSYPNFGGPLKALQHPNIQTLAQAANLAHVDLRILVLLRDPLAILTSTVLKRQFVESVATGIRVLLRNYEILIQQLLVLDPSFFHCLDFDYLPNFDEKYEGRLWAGDAASLENFIVPPILRTGFSFVEMLLSNFIAPKPSNKSVEMASMIEGDLILQRQFQYFTELHSMLQKICAI